MYDVCNSTFRTAFSAWITDLTSQHFLQEPTERKLGRRIVTTTKKSRPYFKHVWDHVYDVPLLSSLQQLLSDKFILDEVRALAWSCSICRSVSFYLFWYEFVCTACRCSEGINIMMGYCLTTVMDLSTNHTACSVTVLNLFRYLLITTM